MNTRLLAMLSLVALCGCDAFVTGQYQGDPLLTLEGSILVSEQARLDGDVPIRVSIFWVQSELEGLEDLEVVGEQTVGARAAQPAQYTLEIYHPPAASALMTTHNGTMAIAVVLIYEDVNGDGRRDPAREAVLGGSGQYAVLYTPHGLSEDVFEVALAPGYHVMELEADECEEGDEVLGMEPAEVGERRIDLLIDTEANVLPDIDCDGVHEFEDDDN